MPDSPKYRDLHANPDKLQRKNRPSDEEVLQLRRRVEALEERARREREEAEKFDAVLATSRERPLLAGHATSEGSRRFVARFGKESVAFYRAAQDILISSLGIGTSQGANDDATDISYARAIPAALQGGVNLIDTSLNYRHQRSEHAVAIGLRNFVQDSGGTRDGIVVCTKGGYLVPGAFEESTLSADSVVGGIHSMSPTFLADQIERSRRNLGLETIDVYYLHNPEIELRAIAMPEFMNRVRAAFHQLERAVSDGLLRYYGTATWDGYRTDGLSLRALIETAREIAGDNHHFRFVQLPFNLGMQEALTRRVEAGRTVLAVAEELGITVIGSASLGQGRLLSGLAMEVTDTPPVLRTDAQRAIQFVRSTPGISSALVGMRKVAHVTENLVISKVPPRTSSHCPRNH